MECKLSGTTPPPPPTVKEWDKHRLWVAAEAYQLDPAWKLLEVEHALRAVIGTVWLQGRLDALVLYNGKYWSLQWKTFTGDRLDLIDRVRLSWHEAAYEYLAKANGYRPWGGTILGACEKLPGYRMAYGGRRDVSDEERINAFTTHYVCRGHEVQARMEHDLRVMLERMDSDWSKQTRNYDSCYSRGRRCPFFGVCHDGEPLGDFDLAEPRYPV